MPRSYRDVQMYENEIMKTRREGKSLREMGEQLGLTHKQVHNLVTRYNAKQACRRNSSQKERQTCKELCSNRRR